MSSLSSTGCAGICCSGMNKGQSYTFFFKYGGWFGLNVDQAGVAKTVAADGNFLNPVATQANCGLFCKSNAVIAVSFTFNGQQDGLVKDYGAEMQNILANFWLTGFGTSLIFEGASNGSVNAACVPNTGSSWIPWLVGGAVVIVLLAVFVPDILSFEALRSRS